MDLAQVMNKLIIIMVTLTSWCWKEDPVAGLDLVPTYEGNATARTISHNLGVVPHWTLIRNIDQNRNWVVYHHKKCSRNRLSIS